MSTPCDPCNPCNQPICEDCLPLVDIPCVNGEPCADITDTHCVVYTGINFTNLDIRTNDRLDAILHKFDENHGSSAIQVQDTNTTHVTGTGITTAPLETNVKVDADPENIIQVNTNGLLVKFDSDTVKKLFTIIMDDPDLCTLFSQLGTNCSPASCALITDLQTNIT